MNEDSLFKCIQKANDVLSNPTTRKQFDSVDEAANVPPPSKKSKGDFIKLWGPVFEAEGRFSNVQPVPSLGTMESAKEDFDGFYSFFTVLTLGELLSTLTKMFLMTAVTVTTRDILSARTRLLVRNSRLKILPDYASS